MSTNSPRPSKADRREAARAEALKLRDEAKRREKRNRMLAIGGLTAAVAVLVVAVILILGQEAKPIAYRGSEPLDISQVTTPSAANDKGGIPVGTDRVAGSTVEGDAVVVEVVYDYQCPHCANFEAANHADIASLLESGNVQFIFRPVSFMDYASNGKEFSTRASNAAAVVADRSPEYFLDFHGALFANQPTGNGLTDDDIADIAREVGVPQETIDEFTTTAPSSDERVFSRWIAAATELVSDELGLSTPTIIVDGQRFPGQGVDPNIIYQPGGLAAGVLERKAERGLE